MSFSKSALLDDVLFAACVAVSWMFVMRGTAERYHWFPSPGQATVVFAALIAICAAVAIGQVRTCNGLIRMWLSVALAGIATHALQSAWPTESHPWESRMILSARHAIGLASGVMCFGLVLQVIPLPRWVAAIRSPWGRALIFYATFFCSLQMPSTFCGRVGYSGEQPSALLTGMFLLLVFAAVPRPRGSNASQDASNASNRRLAKWVGVVNACVMLYLAAGLVDFRYNPWRVVCDECCTGP